MSKSKPLLAAFLALAVPALAAPDKPVPPQLQGRVTGKPVSCVSITQIDDTDRVTDDVILFRMKGGRVYRNDLPIACPRLSRSGSAISYRVPTGSLCSGQIINVFDPSSGLGYGSCNLGRFTPYELPPKPKR